MPQPADCSRCKHFTGHATWSSIAWGCTKGHAPESTVTLKRYHGCKDYREADRDELIFRRFKVSADWYGDDVLKSRKVQARRTATSLAKSLADFGELMDVDQVQAGKAAIAALNRLADDIERAAKLAKAYKARKDAERAEERRRHADTLADRLLHDWSAEEIEACARDIVRFLGDFEASKWLDQRHGRRMLTGGGAQGLPDALFGLSRAANDKTRAEALAEVRRELAELLRGLEHPGGPDYATRADFDAYRQWKRDQSAAKASVAALVTYRARQAPPFREG